MVHCIVFSCGSRNDRDKGIRFYRIPSVIKSKSAFKEELMTKRREKWIQAISQGDKKAKDTLKSKQVCNKHFVSGKPSPYWDKHNIDWVPTLELGKKSYGCEIDYEARAERQERVKKREKYAIEQQECEVAEKCWKLSESSLPVAQIDFNQPSTSTEEEKTGNEGKEDAFTDDLIACDEGSESDEIRTKIMRDAECQADTE